MVIKALVIAAALIATGCTDPATLDCSSDLAAAKSIDQIKNTMSEIKSRQMSDVMQRTAARQIYTQVAQSLPSAMAGKYQAPNNDMATILAPICGMSGDEIIAYGTVSQH